MKIGILTDVLNEHSGARAAIKLGEALAKLDECEIVFLATDKLISHETLERLKESHKVRIFGKPMFVSLELIRILKEEGIELVSAHCSLRILVSAYLSGIKIFRTDYGTQFPSVNGNYDSWKISLARRLILRFGDVYVFMRDYLKFLFSYRSFAISHDHARKIRKLFGKKVDYAYLGGDSFDSKNLYQRQNFSSTVRILSVSRFVPYKGFHLLIRAFKNLAKDRSNLELVLAGGQSDKAYFGFLKKLSGEDTDIRFMIDPSDEILSEQFGSSQIYASGTRWEAFGLPFLEAAHFGLPSLAFYSFGPSDEVIIDNETGLLAKNFEDFSKKLEKLVLDRELRVSLGKNAQHFAQTFNWDKTARNYLEIFKKNGF